MNLATPEASAVTYTRAISVDGAVARGSQAGSCFLAGGTDMLPLWKAGIPKPGQVIDVAHLPLKGVSGVAGQLQIGALAKLSDLACHTDVTRDFPLLSQAILTSACAQVRNMASLSGCLLQRTRCVYFRGEGHACNKRTPGSGCAALLGENRQAALFGGSEACVATHASDVAVALVALDATLDIVGPMGARCEALQDLYRLPGLSPERDSNLGQGELIISVSVPDSARFAQRSTYLKIRDRASFEFAVVSVAAALVVERGLIVEARLAAGGVAPLPWRLVESEQALIGQLATPATFATAAQLAIEGAHPLEHNAFKVELLRRAVIRALQTVGTDR